MDNNVCFSLYAAEAAIDEEAADSKDPEYHAFLMLVDETPGGNTEIIEELHFVMKIKGLAEGQKPYLHAITMPNAQRDLPSLKTLGYVGGSAEVMRPVWEHALDVGFEVGQLQKAFSTGGDPSGINCRAGVKAVIDSLGLDYAPVIEGDGEVAIGTRSNLVIEIPKSAHLCDFEL